MRPVIRTVALAALAILIAPGSAPWSAGRPSLAGEGADEAFENQYWQGHHKRDLLLELVETYRQAGKLDKALEAAGKIVNAKLPVRSDFPPSLEGEAHRLKAHGAIADLHLAAGDPTRAIQALQTGLEDASASQGLTPDLLRGVQAELYEKLGRIHKERGEADQAAAYLEKALSLME